jgi:hypothetical protein
VWRRAGFSLQAGDYGGWDWLHVGNRCPTGDEITIEGEHITPDHKAIITPDGHMIANTD